MRLSRIRIGMFMLVGVIISIALTLALTANAQNAFADEPAEQSKGRVGEYNFVNNEGLLFGVPYTDDNGVFVIPDMMRVLTSDGSYGYVDVKAQQLAIVDNATTEEEMFASIASTAVKKGEALVAAYNEYYGIDALTSDLGYDIGEMMMREMGPENSRTLLTINTRDRLVDAVLEGDIPIERAGMLLTEAIDSALIDTAEASERTAGIELPDRQIPNVKLDLSIAGAKAGPEGKYYSEKAEKLSLCAKIAMSKDASLINASTVSIPEESFNAIYCAAQEKTAVYVPVYAEDGCTVIGEYQTNRM